MSGNRTKSQQAKRMLDAAEKAKLKYWNDKALHKQALHNRWQYMFIGTMPIEQLWECFGITKDG